VLLRVPCARRYPSLLKYCGEHGRLKASSKWNAMLVDKYAGQGSDKGDAILVHVCFTTHKQGGKNGRQRRIAFRELPRYLEDGSRSRWVWTLGSAAALGARRSGKVADFIVVHARLLHDQFPIMHHELHEGAAAVVGSWPRAPQDDLNFILREYLGLRRVGNHCNWNPS
jgi:hypothetical protein